MVRFLRRLLRRGQLLASKRWRKLLLSPREVRRALSKERMRSDRSGLPFGIVLVDFLEDQNKAYQFDRMCKIIHQRLRLTDERGLLSRTQICILLPITESDGTETVASDIRRLLSEAKITVNVRSYVYPSDWIGFDSEDRNETRSRELSVDRKSDSSEYADAEHESPSLLFAVDYPRWKRVMDVVGSGVGLILSSPILLTAMLLIKATSPGPVLFTQPRAGRGGQPFTMYKLRTMVIDAEARKTELLELNERDGPAFKMAADPRITPIGRALRATGIDELPQLWNVLRGDMALVGPRPLPCPEQAASEVWHQRRLEAKPGLTCYWQIAKRERILFADWMRLDLKYADRISITRDLQLIIKTVWCVLHGRIGH